MTSRKREIVTPFRRMRLVEVNDQLANEKLIRQNDPVITSMARVLPQIRNPKRTKNPAADLAVAVANMQHYKALERQRQSEAVQAMETEFGGLTHTDKPITTRATRAKRKRSGASKSMLFSPRRTRKNEAGRVLRVYK